MIIPGTLYPTKTTPADADFPQGGPKDITTPGDGTGSPWTAAVIKDLWSLQQGLALRSGVVPSGTPDTAPASQQIEALSKLCGIRVPAVSNILAQDLSVFTTVAVSAWSTAGDGGAGVWRNTGGTGSPGTTDRPNGFIYDGVGTEFKWDVGVLTFEAFGKAFQHAIDFAASEGLKIEIPGGADYSLGTTGLVLKNGTVIEGPGGTQGAASERAKFTYTGAAAAFTSSGGDAVRVSGFNIEAATGGGIDGSASDLDFGYFGDLVISAQDFGFKGGTGSGDILLDRVAAEATAGEAFDLTAGVKVSLYKCRATGSTTGVQIAGASSVTLIDADISGNVTGANLVATSAPVVFINPVFSGNTGKDLVVASGALNPDIYGLSHVKSNSGLPSFEFGGTGGSVRGFYSTGVDAGDAAFLLSGQGLTLQGGRIVQGSGKSVVGVKISGDENAARDVIFEADSAAMTALRLESGAERNRVNNLIYDGVTGAPVVDLDPSTIYEDAILFETQTQDATGGRVTEGFFVEKDLWINRAWVIYPDPGIGASATNLEIGNCITPGSPTYTAYYGAASGNTKSAWDKETLSGFAANPQIPPTGVLLAGNDGSATLGGNIKLSIEMTPYRTTN